MVCLGFPTDSAGKESTCSAVDTGDASSIPGKIPWRRKWHPTPVFLPEKSHGQGSLVGYGLWVTKNHTQTEAGEQAHQILPVLMSS